MKKTKLDIKKAIKEIHNSILNEKDLKKASRPDKEDELSKELDKTGVVDEPNQGSSIEDIQQNLQDAHKQAQGLGDPKLAQQIANTLTYLMRSHVLKQDIAETKRIQELAGINRMQELAGIKSLNEGFSTNEGEKFKEIFQILGEVTGTEYDDFDEFIGDNPGASEVLITWIEENFEYELSEYFTENDYSKDHVEKLGLYSIAEKMQEVDDESDKDNNTNDNL